jgi:hypothetical protein
MISLISKLRSAYTFASNLRLTIDTIGAFGARNVPKCMRAISILGMKQARAWNCGSLNEFRKFFGLKTYDTFEEINPDPYVAEQLKHLYGRKHTALWGGTLADQVAEHPDFVELYPGIATEAAKEPMIPGVGIAPTYTISRAVLSDAVALVRGDRFYTVSPASKNCRATSPTDTSFPIRPDTGVEDSLLICLDRLQSQEPHKLGLQRSSIRSQHQPRLCLLQIVPSSIPQPFQA